MKQKASIDMGSNSFLLTIANVEDGRVVELIEDQIRLVRLGQGVDQNARLHPEAEMRAFRALEEFRKICVHHNIEPSSVHAVGTSALRDASHRDSFIAEITKRTGFVVRVIPGEEEAWWSYQGALSSLSLPTNASPCLIDIGGGSTEIVWSGGEECYSMDVGVVRARERFLLSDPPTQTEQTALKDELLSQLKQLPQLPFARPLLAVAGTPTTLITIHKKMETYDGSLVHGTTLTQSILRSLLAQLCAMDLDERKKVTGLHPQRADLIIGGAVILLTLMEQMQQEELIVSDRGLRVGLLVGER